MPRAVLKADEDPASRKPESFDFFPDFHPGVSRQLHQVQWVSQQINC
jgi:hypothetical protein